MKHRSTLPIAVLLVTLATGCVSRTQAIVATGVGVAMTAVGALAARSLEGTDDGPAVMFLSPPVLVFVGVITVVASAPVAVFGPIAADDRTPGQEACRRLARHALAAADPAERASRVAALSGCTVVEQ